MACVIFDMDGVLVDTAPFHMQAWQAFGKQHGIEMTPEMFHQTFGMKNAQIFPMLLGNGIGEAKSQAMNEEKEALFRKCIHGQVKPLPGVIALFESLRDRRVVCTVGSSGARENVALVVKELGLDRFVDGFVSGDDVEFGKPNPGIFLKAAQFCGAKVLDCLVVEDAAVGVEAAKSADMACVAVTNTCNARELALADVVVHSLDEINAVKIIQLIESNRDRGEKP